MNIIKQATKTIFLGQGIPCIFHNEDKGLIVRQRATQAIRDMDLASLEQLKTYDLTFTNREGNTLLHELIIECYRNNARSKYEFNIIIERYNAILLFLLKNTILSNDDSDFDGRTPLHYAALISTLHERLGSHMFRSLLDQAQGRRVLFKRDCASLMPIHYLPKDLLEPLKYEHDELIYLDNKFIQESFNNFQLFKSSFEKEYADKEISAEKFDQVVKAFKLCFHLKTIRKVFSKQVDFTFEYMDLRRRLLDIFFADSIISNYLLRSSPQTNGFDLILPSKYEKSLYLAHIERRSYFYIPFRGCGLPNGYFDNLGPQKGFYERATPVPCRQVIFSNEHSLIKHMLTNNISFSFKENGIYEVANEIASINNGSINIETKNNTKSDFKYYVWTNGADDHAFLMAGVFDITTRKIICALLINSWDNKDYYNFLKDKFKTRSEIPFIDCSINVQVNENDNNCFIYASILGRGLVELFFKEPKKSQRVFKTYQIKTIQEFIRTSILRYIPEYYKGEADNKFYRKSLEELRDFHMQKRWDIGRQSIQEISKKAKQRLAQSEGQGA